MKLTAEDVAKRVWDAAHGKRVHYFLQNDVALLARIGNLVPRLGRRVMKSYAGDDARTRGRDANRWITAPARGCWRSRPLKDHDEG